jgi:nucleotide-binding universal stress UspA family protein
VHTPHVAFASGPALSGALNTLEADVDRRSAGAVAHVNEFCARENIEIRDVPSGSGAVTASLCEEVHNAHRRLMFYARHSDLVVMGRSKRPNGLPADLIETLLLGCGRPILLASTEAPGNIAGTVMVCWRDTPDAARAVVAAMPFLVNAKRVVFVGIGERDSDIVEAVGDVADQFRWSGVATDVEIVAPKGRPISDVLSATAAASGADLVVMGAYGHSRTRELIFGGCTQAVIRHAYRPVLLLH